MRADILSSIKGRNHIAAGESEDIDSVLSLVWIGLSLGRLDGPGKIPSLQQIMFLETARNCSIES